MTNTQKKAEVKQLLKATFWQLSDIADQQLTPKLIRRFLTRQVDHSILEHFALNISGFDFWLRLESLCNMAKTARKFI